MATPLLKKMMKGPKCWKGYVAKGKKKSPSGKKNPDGSPNTAHTTNAVPIILVDKEKKRIKEGILGDIAPTILDLLEVEIPKIMTQKSLLIK